MGKQRELNLKGIVMTDVDERTFSLEFLWWLERRNWRFMGSIGNHSAEQLKHMQWMARNARDR